MLGSWSGACCASTKLLKRNTTKEQLELLAGFHHLQSPSCQVQYIPLHSMLALLPASDAGLKHESSHASITWQAHGYRPEYEQLMSAYKNSKLYQTQSCRVL